MCDVIQDYVLKKKDYLMTQVGNPDGADKPNKKVRSRVMICISDVSYAFSSTIPVSGFERVKRPWLNVSRKHARIWVTSVSSRCML